MASPDTLSVVVPVFNEAERLRESLDRLLKVELPLQLEILVVDDGSTDGSASTISDLVDEGRVKLISHERNRGKSHAVRTGIGAATGDLLTIFDADLEYDPEDYVELLEPILNGRAEVVYGTRSFGSHTAFSFWYVIGNRFLSFWASFLFNTWLSDIETCFKLAPLEEWRAVDLRTEGFGIEAEVTAKLLRRGHRIYEVPISYQARSRAEGKKLNWTDGIQALWILLRVRLFRR
ncbi:MAG TPA: glycosyltransferase family 2 protein [Actinomycetota bacterium]|nr:glycosyltransferase family 2 protein [Actinomycetota bacterium]